MLVKVDGSCMPDPTPDKVTDEEADVVTDGKLIEGCCIVAVLSCG